jgi:hypothetical protein
MMWSENRFALFGIMLWPRARNDTWIPCVVIRGLDPRIHPLRERMDCRVEPGNDDAGNGDGGTVMTAWGTDRTCDDTMAAAFLFRITMTLDRADPSRP